MSRGYDLRMEHHFAAPPDEVFRCWTDPDELKNWYQPVAGWVTTAEIDLKVGGKYRIAFGPEGQDPFVETGEYLEVDPPKRLLYTLHLTTQSGTLENVISVDFVADGSGTLVRLEEKGYPTRKIRDQHAGGWGTCLNNLEELIRSKV